MRRFQIINTGVRPTGLIYALLKASCERCSKDLPADQEGAVICSFECTFCIECASEYLEHVCPNCGGNLEFRPLRSAQLLKDYPASE